MKNPNNCGACKHKQHPDGGWCYMFRDEPRAVCMVHSLRNTQGVTDKFMVFDVGRIGLHGEGFAVAWVVVGRNGERLDEGCIACDPADCAGTAEGRLWVSESVPPLKVTSPTKQHLRNTFWHEWRRWANQGAVLVADCAWPVEANFLSACVHLNHAEREWQGPCPLHDLASIMMAHGVDLQAVAFRLPDELPMHHPLMDARQSARQLVACLGAPNTKARDCRAFAAAQLDRKVGGNV